MVNEISHVVMQNKKEGKEMQMECMKHERPNLKRVLLKLRSEIS